MVEKKLNSCHNLLRDQSGAARSEIITRERFYLFFLTLICLAALIKAIKIKTNHDNESQFFCYLVFGFNL